MPRGRRQPDDSHGTRADATTAQTGRLAGRLQINEIYQSIQGESRHAGRPCVLIRLTACNLRCTWCDTAYAFEEGGWSTVGEILQRVASFGTRYVLVTGGEPLLQKGVHDLVRELLDGKYEVSIETGGSLDISGLDRRAMVVMDIKCPGSLMQEMNRWENLGHLKPADEIKFVVADRADYEWACEVLRRRGLGEKCGVLMSPVHGVLEPALLAKWILADRLAVRLQIQIHKYIWPAATRGV